MNLGHASVIADSITRTGDRLTTIEVTLHRFILAELNTHRVFSRNASSSRAIPIDRQIDQLNTNPAIPLVFGQNQAGMQAGDPIADQHEATNVWLAARDSAISHAKTLQALGVHKQVVNRLLEPFMWQTVIISATEWDNFFTQRCSPLAQPEMQAAAEHIRAAYTQSEPTTLYKGEWHLPYIQPDEHDLPLETKQQLSVARCARVSYLTHHGTRDQEADLRLYQRLITAQPPHWSPMEHVATPGDGPGNLTGWIQLRHYPSRPGVSS